MYKVELIVDGCERPPRDHGEHGRFHKIGTVIVHDDAWMLCLPEPSTEIIRAKPLDDDTKKKVEHELAKRAKAIETRDKRNALAAAEKKKAKRSRRPTAKK